jgi:hypothetical protein
MALIEKDTALVDLGSHLIPLREAFLAAWADWQALPAEFKVNLTSTTRANIVHDRAVGHAAKLLDRHVEIRDLSGLKALIFDDQYAVRLKKLDNDLFSRNQPSDQVKDFRGQISLPGMELSHNLEFGYVLHSNQQEIVGTYLVCPNGSGHYWTMEVGDNAIKAQIIDMFDPSGKPTEDLPGQQKTIFKPKAPARDKDKIVPFKKKEDGDDGP